MADKSSGYLLEAPWIFPIDAPPLRQGALWIQGGKILAVGPASELAQRAPQLPRHAWTRHVLMPGMINAHTHLELSHLRGKLAPGPFPEWVEQLMALLPPGGPRGPVAAGAAELGAQESLASGTTCLGDISRHWSATRAALTRSPLKIVSFAEITAIGPGRNDLDERLAAFLSAEFIANLTPSLMAGLSPHAPYSVEGPSLRRIVAEAVEQQLPICMHLAELAQEEPFLRELSGPLGASWGLWQKLGGFDPEIPTFSGSPVAWADAFDLLQAPVPVLLAHGNYLSDADVALLKTRRASLVICPRTREFFGHSHPHRWRELKAAGLCVALGTDSLASNPDLHLLREARRLKQLEPDLRALDLLEMATLQGARALGLEARMGSLTPGKEADVLALPMPGAYLAGEAEKVACGLLALAPIPDQVWINGLPLGGEMEL